MLRLAETSYIFFMRLPLLHKQEEKDLLLNPLHDNRLTN